MCKKLLCTLAQRRSSGSGGEADRSVPLRDEWSGVKEERNPRVTHDMSDLSVTTASASSQQSSHPKKRSLISPYHLLRLSSIISVGNKVTEGDDVKRDGPCH